MDGPMQERDWKYMKSIREELLQQLCSRINARATVISAEQGCNSLEQYRALYSYIEEADQSIADCFDDWRRSMLSARVLALRRHGLLTQEHECHLSEDAQRFLDKIKDVELR